MDSSKRMLSFGIDFVGINSPGRPCSALSTVSSLGSPRVSSGLKVAPWRMKLERQILRWDISLYMRKAILCSFYFYLNFNIAFCSWLESTMEEGSDVEICSKRKTCIDRMVKYDLLASWITESAQIGLIIIKIFWIVLIMLEFVNSFISRGIRA